MTTATRILKFGGTSVGTPEALARALGIVRESARRHRPVVVVSALHGVTDALVGAVDAAAAGQAGGGPLSAELRQRHEALLEAAAAGRPGQRGRVDLAHRLA